MAEISKWKIPEIAGFRGYGKIIIYGKNKQPLVNPEDSGDWEIRKLNEFGGNCCSRRKSRTSLNHGKFERLEDFGVRDIRKNREIGGLGKIVICARSEKGRQGKPEGSGRDWKFGAVGVLRDMDT